jgi:hypothetical protein
MSFPQMPSFLNNAQSQESAGSNAGIPAGGIDSISLGQLKQLVASMPKDKVRLRVLANISSVDVTFRASNGGMTTNTTTRTPS